MTYTLLFNTVHCIRFQLAILSIYAGLNLLRHTELIIHFTTIFFFFRPGARHCSHKSQSLHRSVCHVSTCQYHFPLLLPRQLRGETTEQLLSFSKKKQHQTLSCMTTLLYHWRLAQLEWQISFLSFQEILANENIKLDWFFRASFAQDIAMVTETFYFAA